MSNGQGDYQSQHESVGVGQSANDNDAQMPRGRATHQNGWPKAVEQPMGTHPDRRLSDPDSDIAGTSPNREDLVRHLSISEEMPPENNSSFKYSELGLSGNVISVNFCVPYKIKHAEGDKWVSQRGKYSQTRC